jgi:hypothetical protein
MFNFASSLRMYTSAFFTLSVIITEVDRPHTQYAAVGTVATVIVPCLIWLG